MQQEAAYLGALAKVTGYTPGEGTLVLTGPGVTVELASP
jgi:hypothetical protein